MAPPRTREAALHGGSPERSAGHANGTDSTTKVGIRRNSGRGGHAPRAALAIASKRAQTPRQAWIEWLSPTFSGNESCYFTGTYSDAYGAPYGLMLPRNVVKDWKRFIEGDTGFLDLDKRKYIIGIEKHAYRDILHLHGIIEGPFTADERRYLKLCWQASQRGFCKPLPVLDGCASYVTKYALKGDTESFEWRLTT